MVGYDWTELMAFMLLWTVGDVQHLVQEGGFEIIIPEQGWVNLPREAWLRSFPDSTFLFLVNLPGKHGCDMLTAVGMVITTKNFFFCEFVSLY
jgi:hypothetical protein